MENMASQESKKVFIIFLPHDGWQDMANLRNVIKELEYSIPYTVFCSKNREVPEFSFVFLDCFYPFWRQGEGAGE